MLKKLFIYLISIIFITGCNSTRTNETTYNSDNKNNYESVTIKLNLTDKKDVKAPYLIYLMLPDTKTTEPGKATQGGYYGPLKTNDKGEATIDLSLNWDLNYFLDQTQNGKLEVFVTTTEDIYIRNPLNEPTYIEFIKNNNEDTKIEYSYYSTIKSKSISIADKYPEGVLSLTFPDATFVIKLEFADNIVPDSSYLVSIVRPSENGNFIGTERNGRLARKFQYWDTPFFKSDNLSAWNGTIVVTDYHTDEIIDYEGFPKQVTFDKNGKCNEGDIYTIKIIE